MLSSVVIGCGSYLPKKIVTNDDLALTVDTSDEWITTRTGIKQRHFAEDGECTSDMATCAAKAAIDNSGITVDEIDLIIVATTTPDKTFPATAVLVQKNLNMASGAGFDVQAVCAGFVYGLSIADSFIKSGQHKTVMVIGADKMSSLIDWDDRRTCVLFGDGAGAVILQSSEQTKRGILHSNIFSDGGLQDILYTDGGVSSSGDAGKVRMSGQEVFKHAAAKMVSSVNKALKECGIDKDSIDFLIPHQANGRIIEMVGKKLRMQSDKTISTVELHANTSAASIPLALSEANSKGIFKQGDLLALTAIGGGMAWGSCLLRW